jgi:hypothetical protein
VGGSLYLYLEDLRQWVTATFEFFSIFALFFFSKKEKEKQEEGKLPP